MKTKSLLSEKKRQSILIELEKKSRKFVELKKILKLESNLLSYNLNILIKEGLVEKNNLIYSLTNKAKSIMPYVRKTDGSSSIPLPCVAVIIRKNGEILIRDKPTEPERGKKIFIGGGINSGETIFEAAERHVEEKVGIKINKLKLICINNYISKGDKTISHFTVFFITASPNGIPKNAKYKDPNKIRGKMFPDNRFIIKNGRRE